MNWQNPKLLIAAIVLLLFDFGYPVDQNISGYLKNLSSVSSYKPSEAENINYLHNRINYSVIPFETTTGVIELRNRWFYASGINSNGGMSQRLRSSSYDYDLYVIPLDNKNNVLHSEVDRAYVQTEYHNIELTVGRQRVNWGVNLAWNPNDLFNVYNFADFDYPERPGTDGVRVEYFFSGMSSVQFVTNAPLDISDLISAGLFRWNQWNYDLQVLAGRYKTDVVLGAGVAGNIYNAGLKGEITWFEPMDRLIDGAEEVSMAVSTDYFFEKPIYLSGAVLINSIGSENSNMSQILAGQSLSPKNLMPSKYSALAQVGYTLTPLTTLDMTAMYAFGLQGLYAIPSFNYSPSENWKVSVMYQGLFHLNMSHFQVFQTGYMVASYHF